MFCSHVGRDDQAQEVLDAHTPKQAKEIASRIPSHLGGSCNKIKSNVMEEILEATTIYCSEFKKALINSLGKHLVVEAVKSDIFWSCGLNPRDAKTTKTSYHPGMKRLGLIHERVRSKVLHRNSDKTNDQKTCTSDVKKTSTLVPKSTDSHPQNVNNMADMLTTTLAIKHVMDTHLAPSSTSLSDISTSITPTPVTSPSDPTPCSSMSSNVREIQEATLCDDKSRLPVMVSGDSDQVMHTSASLKINHNHLPIKRFYLENT